MNAYLNAVLALFFYRRTIEATLANDGGNYSGAMMKAGNQLLGLHVLPCFAHGSSQEFIVPYFGHHTLQEVVLVAGSH